MPEDIIPPRNSASAPTESDIIPPRQPKDENSNAIETVIPARNSGEGLNATIDATKQTKPFEPKIGRVRFFIELSAIFFFLDLCPFLLTLIDAGVITAFIIEPLKWGIAGFAFAVIFTRALFVGIKFFGVNPSIKSVAKNLIAPVIELIPVLNGFTPGWTIQYVITIAPVVFDIEALIKQGGKVGALLSYIPGFETVLSTTADLAKAPVSK